MNNEQAALLALMLAAALANLPFARLVTIRRWHGAAQDAVGWLLCYVLWMAAAASFESALGKSVPKDWEVWAVSAALFAVLAFPGIVWRHLLKKPGL